CQDGADCRARCSARYEFPGRFAAVVDLTRVTTSSQRRLESRQLQPDTHDVAEIDPAEQKLSEVSVQDALSLAVQLHHVGHLDQAETLYKRILEAAPDQPDALHFLGILLHAQGHSEEAIELINRSIRLDP